MTLRQGVKAQILRRVQFFREFLERESRCARGIRRALGRFLGRADCAAGVCDAGTHIPRAALWRSFWVWVGDGANRTRPGDGLWLRRPVQRTYRPYDLGDASISVDDCRGFQAIW